MPSIGPFEILAVLVVALIVLGPKRLPEVARQVGRGLRELRRFQEDVRDELGDAFDLEGATGSDQVPKLPPKRPVAPDDDAGFASGGVDDTGASAAGPPGEAPAGDPASEPPAPSIDG